MTSDAVKRHLSRSSLEEYLAMSAPATVVVPGTPACRILVDPTRLEMALRTPHFGCAVGLGTFERVRTRIVFDCGVTWDEVVIDYRGHGHEAYLMLSDIADMIQQNSFSFGAAAQAALTTFEDLLARSYGLNAERQIGLYGELLFLESCLETMKPSAALEAWKGPVSHEHDFVFDGGECVEVKSTKAERRWHRIGSLEQLQASPATNLWFVSVQLTLASRGIGRTLPEVVERIREVCSPCQPAVESALAQAGWRDRDRLHYGDVLSLRTVPAAFIVDHGFPVLNRKAIEEACDRPELITDASYMVDVTSLARSHPPPPVDRFVERDG